MVAYVPTLKKMYKEQIVPALVKEFNYTSVMQVPVLEKIVINQGLGQAIGDKKILETAIDELTKITGQRAVATRSKKDISNFKLRKGMPIGARVTLRHNKMYEFLERLVAVALPRIRDFKESTTSLMVAATIRWELQSRLSSRRSTLTRSRRFWVWRSPL